MRLVPYRISRYVFAELLTPFMLGLSLYTFVLMMNHFFLVAEKALSKNLGWDLTAQLFLVGVPRILVLSIPMSVLLGVMIAVGRISADHEWVALQGAGQGPTRLLKPVLVFGLATTLISLVLYGYVVPSSNFTMRNLRGQILFASNLASDLKPRVFYTDLPNSVLYVGDIVTGAAERRLKRVFLVNLLGDHQTELLLAGSGDLYPAPDGSGSLIVDLYDGISHHWRDDRPENYQFVGFDHRREVIPMAEHLRAFLAPPDPVAADLPPRELAQELLAARTAYRDAVAKEATPGEVLVTKLRYSTVLIEALQRLALPSACFVLAILALPLGITRVRSGKGAGFAMSLLVILVYWVVFTLGRNQAVAGNLPEWLGTWLANLVMLPWAAIGILRLYRNERDRRSPLRAGVAWIAAALRGLAARLRRGRERPAEANGEPPDALADFGGTSSRFVRRFDTYVAASFLRILFFTVLSAYTIYGLVELKTLMDGVLRHHQPVGLVLRYFQYFAPGVLHIVLPISCLVGAVVTFSLLTRSGELTAMKSSGVSMRRATLPVLLLTALLSGVVFWVQDRIAPTTNRLAQEVKDTIEGRTPRSYVTAARKGRFSIDPDWTKLYHYRFYEPEQQRFNDLTVLTLQQGPNGDEAPRILDHRYARTAHWTGQDWALENGWYRSFPAGQDGVMEFRRFEEAENVPLAAPEAFAGQALRFARLGDLAEQLSVKELHDEIEALDARGYDITRLKVDYHTRWAHPWSPLVMVLLGLPFAFKVGRRGSLYGVGVALLLVLVYWAALAIFSALGLETILDPVVAAWTPNVLFTLVGVYLMLFIRT